jgi:hypothetical protein
MTIMQPLEILFICNKPEVSQDANTIVDHIEAFEQYSHHRIHLLSMFGKIPQALDLNRFDVLIIHYSSSLLYDHFIAQQSKQRIAAFSGLKVVFVQDEYRQINKMNAELRALNIDVLFTCFPETEFKAIYGSLNTASIYNNLTGYVPERFTTVKGQIPIKDRPLHVGYRGRKLPYWLGALAHEKSQIVDKWLQHPATKSLQVDLSYHEKDRLYGHAWVDYLSSCKATLGVESGASVMDFTGDLEKTIDAHQSVYPQDSFLCVQEKYLLNAEGQHKLNQISPRCFESIALKTVLVLYEGEYSGILIPDKHYISLKKDFSNIEVVVNKLLDDDFLQQMADRAFVDIAMNPKYGYRSFIQRVDEIIDREYLVRNKHREQEAYLTHEYLKASRPLFQWKPYAYKCYKSLPRWLQLSIRMLIRSNTLKPYLINLMRRIVQSR